MDQELAALRGRVDELEQQVRSLEAAVSRLQAPLFPAQPAPQAVRPQPVPVRPPSPPPRPPRTQAEREQLFSVWLNRIGVVLLVLAAIYGFSWAVQNDYIGPAGRVAIGYLAALVTLGIGYYTNRKGYRNWALGVSGGGVALLYVPTFAAYQYYHVFSYQAAFALMLVFTVFGGVLSLYYDAVPIAWLGALGGFLTPFLLYTGHSNTLGLYTYIALVDLGILSLAAFRQWRSLHLLGLAATWIIFSIGAFGYTPGEWGVIFGFATLFFAIFATLGVLYNLLHRQRITTSDLILLVINSFVYFGWGLALIHDHPATRPWQGFFAVIMAVLYLVLGYIAIERNPDDKYLALSFLGLSGVFLTIAIPAQLNGDWIALAWAVEGAVLCGLGLYLNLKPARWLGLGVLALAMITVLVHASDEVSPVVRTLAWTVNVAALWTGAWLYQRYREAVSKDEAAWSGILAVAANVLTLIWWTQEISRHYDHLIDAQVVRFTQSSTRGAAAVDLEALRSQSDTAISGVWAVYGFALMVIGFVRRSRGARLLALGVLGLTLLKVAFKDIWYLHGGWRALGLLILSLVLLTASYLYFRFRNRLLSKGEEA